MKGGSPMGKKCEDGSMSLIHKMRYLIKWGGVVLIVLFGGCVTYSEYIKLQGNMFADSAPKEISFIYLGLSVIVAVLYYALVNNFIERISKEGYHD